MLYQEWAKSNYVNLRPLFDLFRSQGDFYYLFEWVLQRNNKWFQLQWVYSRRLTEPRLHNNDQLANVNTAGFWPVFWGIFRDNEWILFSEDSLLYCEIQFWQPWMFDASSVLLVGPLTKVPWYKSMLTYILHSDHIQSGVFRLQMNGIFFLGRYFTSSSDLPNTPLKINIESISTEVWFRSCSLQKKWVICRCCRFQPLIF